MQPGAKLNCVVRTHSMKSWRRLLPVLLVMLAGLAATKPALAQEPPQRQIRTFIPPDQIVSFLPTTNFQTFLESINPIFVQVTGKRVIDPENRNFPIGVSVVGMQFFDAFELVLDAHQLTYRETDKYFLIENAPEEQQNVIGPGAAKPKATSVSGKELPTAQDREIEIEALLYEINRTKTRQLGVDWTTFVGTQGAGGAGGGGAGGGGGGASGAGGQANFFIKSKQFFDNFDSWLQAPSYINARQLNSFIRFTEAQGLGRTIANPKISVTSGKQGKIQIGSDIPIQVRDFAGNTITQFVQTGIIINVTPTLITSPVADTAGAPTLDFIHLDVRVDRSQARPQFGGLAIDRSTADTDVLLLDKEMTIIGGLYQTDMSTDRAGFPVIKDLPWWVFGLRYIFGKETKVQTQRELLIVLKAELLDSLPQRAESPYKNDLHLRSREEVMDILSRFDPRLPEKWPQTLKSEGLDKEAGVKSSNKK